MTTIGIEELTARDAMRLMRAFDGYSPTIVPADRRNDRFLKGLIAALRAKAGA